MTITQLEILNAQKAALEARLTQFAAQANLNALQTQNQLDNVNAQIAAFNQ